MLSYCLDCKKLQKGQIQKFRKLTMIKQCYYQDVLPVVLKNQGL